MSRSEAIPKECGPEIDPAGKPHRRLRFLLEWEDEMESWNAHTERLKAGDWRMGRIGQGISVIYHKPRRAMWFLKIGEFISLMKIKVALKTRTFISGCKLLYTIIIFTCILYTYKPTQLSGWTTGPTEQHREHCSVSYDGPSWRRIWKRINMCVRLSHFAGQQ